MARKPKSIKIVLEGEFTDLNTYINVERTHRFKASALKKHETNLVADLVGYKQVPPVNFYPVHIAFTWYTKDKRKDADNVCFSRKFLLDGLVKGGVLFDDSRKYVGGFSDTFAVDKENPRVEIVITKLSSKL
ncbi:MAG: hypothetical protein JKY51_10020 [Opitutaceae bacterium]|nr:hypothetical protein [Opitutaceae bacterium]